MSSHLKVAFKTDLPIEIGDVIEVIERDGSKADFLYCVTEMMPVVSSEDIHFDCEAEAVDGCDEVPMFTLIRGMRIGRRINAKSRNDTGLQDR